jgi:DnaJ-domain-containing protein 1
VRGESRESTVAFQVFKQDRPVDPASPGDGATIDLTDADEDVIDLTRAPRDRWRSCPAEDAERVLAWAERLRRKSERDRATILGEATTSRSTGSDGYWSSSHVAGPEDPTAEPGVVADPTRRSRLLGELGLPADASTDDVAAAYRRLAKQHHPDRWAEADEATRQRNAEEMMRINAVYRALRVSAGA